MNEWALMKNGKVINVVTTSASLRDLQQDERYSGYEIRSFWSLPDDVKEAYEFYRERP